jgi:hypothetical protein
MYKDDKKHDFALMTGNLPQDLPYIGISCERFKKGREYFSFGITQARGEWFDYPRPLVRMNTIEATSYYTGPGALVSGKLQPGMRILKGAIEYGMSGGPVIGSDGLARAANNAGNSVRTLLYEFADTILCQAPKKEDTFPSS